MAGVNAPSAPLRVLEGQEGHQGTRVPHSALWTLALESQVAQLLSPFFKRPECLGKTWKFGMFWHSLVIVRYTVRSVVGFELAFHRVALAVPELITWIGWSRTHLPYRLSAEGGYHHAWEPPKFDKRFKGLTSKVWRVCCTDFVPLSSNI